MFATITCPACAYVCLLSKTCRNRSANSSIGVGDATRYSKQRLATAASSILTETARVYRQQQGTNNRSESRRTRCPYLAARLRGFIRAHLAAKSIEHRSRCYLNYRDG